MTDADTGIRPHANQTRSRLLDAALTAFAERGFHATSTRDIAAAAGMSPAAVYVHHRSKEELLHQISRRGHEATLELVRSATAGSEDPVTQLSEVVRAFAVHHAQANTEARVVNYELASLSEEHLAEILRLRREIAAELRGVVERGVAGGAFDTPDPRMATTALLSLGIDIARWYREERDWSPEDVGAYYAELALRMVGAPR
ncbi:TetR/AcrR family transcriptional regulator [Nocardioides sp. QY071]|uniref:TetR/AcrR family transcriptional regulator n=1 Tax=Nocardioides sp. QY071 TaxID=3044187 RepID=UPI00249A6C56|nr:TetR/AcrR family transcriptional regulator [Nocardioides sp. QY071]WGY02861.1 TetR/AcrR family transcriptional regulator [Nocardioides sp. QY071]